MLSTCFRRLNSTGAVTELAGDFIGNSGLDKEDQVNVSGLIGAGAALVASGDAEGVYTGQTAGSTVHQNNYLNHDQLAQAIKDVQKCGDDADCKFGVVGSYLELSKDQNEVALAACDSGAPECKKYGLALNDASINLIGSNEDGMYELIGDNEDALYAYQMFKNTNLNVMGSLADESIQNYVQELAIALGVSEVDAEKYAVGVYAASAIVGNGKRKVVDGNNNNSDNHFGPSRRAEPGEIFYKTTKEATEAAKVLGFEKTNRRAKNGEAIYYNRKTKEYISRDVGSGKGGAHNGGVWKKAKSIDTINSKQTRLGTFDADLNEIGK